MKDDGDLFLQTSGSAPSFSTKHTSDSNIFSKGRYKFWALAAILLLALWSMFTGTVTLRWSAGNLNRLTDTQSDFPIHDDLDVLELEEREKVVKHMWDVYTHSGRARLPQFWQEAFEAAYEDLSSDDPELRDAATSEIAKMSVRSIRFESPPVQSKAGGGLDKSVRIVEKSNVRVTSEGDSRR